MRTIINFGGNHPIKILFFPLESLLQNKLYYLKSSQVEDCRISNVYTFPKDPQQDLWVVFVVKKCRFSLSAFFAF